MTATRRACDQPGCLARVDSACTSCRVQELAYRASITILVLGSAFIIFVLGYVVGGNS